MSRSFTGGANVCHLRARRPKGASRARWGKNFLRWRIRPVARKLKIPEKLVTFQVMRRTLGTDMQSHGTLKDVQGALRHASIKTTGDIYVQTLEPSVQAAMNSRTDTILKLPRKHCCATRRSGPSQRTKDEKQNPEGPIAIDPSCPKLLV